MIRVITKISAAAVLAAVLAASYWPVYGQAVQNFSKGIYKDLVKGYSFRLRTGWKWSVDWEKEKWPAWFRTADEAGFFFRRFKDNWLVLQADLVQKNIGETEDALAYVKEKRKVNLYDSLRKIELLDQVVHEIRHQSRLKSAEDQSAELYSRTWFVPVGRSETFVLQLTWPVELQVPDEASQAVLIEGLTVQKIESVEPAAFNWISYDKKDEPVSFEYPFPQWAVLPGSSIKKGYRIRDSFGLFDRMTIELHEQGVDELKKSIKEKNPREGVWTMSERIPLMIYQPRQESGSGIFNRHYYWYFKKADEKKTLLVSWVEEGKPHPGFDSIRKKFLKSLAWQKADGKDNVFPVQLALDRHNLTFLFAENNWKQIPELVQDGASGAYRNEIRDLDMIIYTDRVDPGIGIDILAAIDETNWINKGYKITSIKKLKTLKSNRIFIMRDSEDRRAWLFLKKKGPALYKFLFYEQKNREDDNQENLARILAIVSTVKLGPR